MRELRGEESANGANTLSRRSDGRQEPTSFSVFFSFASFFFFFPPPNLYRIHYQAFVLRRSLLHRFGFPDAMSASPSPSAGGEAKQSDQIHFRFCREW